MAYLYPFVGKPWKTQARVRQILDELYTDQPDGYCGNEDCGQMSAWYVLSALGFYPVTPGTPDYVIGTPLFPKVVIHLENGNTFTIPREGGEASDPYIQSATLNGDAFDALRPPVLAHNAILKGGALVFEMGPKPSKWGREWEGGLPRRLEGPAIVAVPFVTEGDRTFRESTTIGLGSFDARDDIYYSAGEGQAFTRYLGPVTLSETTTLRAYALRDDTKSNVIESQFLKLDRDWALKLEHKYANQYAAAGPESLIDGLLGGSDWHTGGWQGFLGKDLIATIDLKSVRSLRGIRGRFLHDQGSWIWLPTEVVVEASVDGESWRPLGAARHDVDPRAPDTEIAWLGLRTAARARYVRVHAKSVGTCPDWHPGVGNPCWIFADELEIEFDLR